MSHGVGKAEVPTGIAGDIVQLTGIATPKSAKPSPTPNSPKPCR
jgi:hypothetical protein